MASKEAKQLFLAVLQSGSSIARAAKAVGMTRQQALRPAHKDSVFAADWDNGDRDGH